MASLHHFILHTQYRRIYPLAEKTFGLVPSRIYGDDTFILKYENPNEGDTVAQASVDAHADASTFTYLIPLTDDFEGGGTRFLYPEQVAKPKAGTLLLFSGQNLHEGLPVTKGTRYVIAGRIHYGGPILLKERDPVVYSWDL